jgi:1,4-alpha-glucan branching enzyme
MIWQAEKAVFACLFRFGGLSGFHWLTPWLGGQPEKRTQSMAKQAQIYKNQTFRLEAPDAGKVLLVGDFTNWQQRPIALKKGTDGVWTASVGLPPGQHNYLFIVDGEWRDDPECAVRVPNPFGGLNMVRQVV